MSSPLLIPTYQAPGTAILGGLRGHEHGIIAGSFDKPRARTAVANHEEEVETDSLYRAR
jgi:hypothetical protein